MKALALGLLALMITGCAGHPGVIKPLPYPEVLPYKCEDGRYRIRNAFSQVNPCPEANS